MVQSQHIGKGSKVEIGHGTFDERPEKSHSGQTQNVTTFQISKSVGPWAESSGSATSFQKPKHLQGGFCQLKRGTETENILK